jgi:hypothetical protein
MACVSLGAPDSLVILPGGILLWRSSAFLSPAAREGKRTNKNTCQDVSQAPSLYQRKYTLRVLSLLLVSNAMREIGVQRLDESNVSMER